MSIKIEHDDKSVTAFLVGEIDHHSAKSMREEIDLVTSTVRPKELILDFSGVSFMDSSGIGLIMGRYKSMQSIDGKVTVQNPSYPIKKVMKLAGLDRIVVFRELNYK